MLAITQDDNISEKLVTLFLTTNRLAKRVDWNRVNGHFVRQSREKIFVLSLAPNIISLLKSPILSIFSNK